MAALCVPGLTMPGNTSKFPSTVRRWCQPSHKTKGKIKIEIGVLDEESVAAAFLD